MCSFKLSNDSCLLLHNIIKDAIGQNPSSRLSSEKAVRIAMKPAPAQMAKPLYVHCMQFRWMRMDGISNDLWETWNRPGVSGWSSHLKKGVFGVSNYFSFYFSPECLKWLYLIGEDEELGSSSCGSNWSMSSCSASIKLSDMIVHFSPISVLMLDSIVEWPNRWKSKASS